MGDVGINGFGSIPCPYASKVSGTSNDNKENPHFDFGRSDFGYEVKNTIISTIFGFNLMANP